MGCGSSLNEEESVNRKKSGAQARDAVACSSPTHRNQKIFPIPAKSVYCMNLKALGRVLKETLLLDVAVREQGLISQGGGVGEGVLQSIRLLCRLRFNAGHCFHYAVPLLKGQVLPTTLKELLLIADQVSDLECGDESNEIQTIDSISSVSSIGGESITGSSSKHPVVNAASLAHHMGIEVEELQAIVRELVKHASGIIDYILGVTPAAQFCGLKGEAVRRTSNLESSAAVHDSEVRGIAALLKGFVNMAFDANNTVARVWDKARAVFLDEVKLAPMADNDSECVHQSSMLSDVEDCTLHDALAKILSQSVAISPRRIELFSIVRIAVGSATSLLGLLMGGSSCFIDGEAFFGGHASPIIHSASKLITSFTEYGCASPNGGMESPDVVEQQATNLRSLLFLLGLLPTGLGVPRESNIDEWVTRLPLHSISGPAKGMLLYLTSITVGQQKLSLKPLHRSLIVEECIQRVSDGIGFAKARGIDLPTSFKLFPAFADEESQIVEAGEGHGPRKECFDLCAKALYSEWSPPVVVRAHMTITLVEGMSVGAITKVGEDEEMAELVQVGNAIEVPFEKCSSPFFAAILSCEQSEVSPSELTVRLSAIAPKSVDDSSFSIRIKQIPVFVARGKYLWLNPAIIDSDTTGKLHQSSFLKHQMRGPSKLPTEVFDQHWFAGWLFGTCIANGVTLPIRLPPFFFKMLTSNYLATEEDLLELDPTLATSLNTIRAMDPIELKEFMVGELGPHHPLSITPDASIFIREHIVRETLHRSVVNRLKAIQLGFRGSMIPSLSIFRSVTAEDFTTIICGRQDDEKADFSFEKEFKFFVDPSLSRYRHTYVFRKLLFELMQSISAEEKRALLKFVTGRALLPPEPKAETLKFFVVSASGPLRETFAQIGQRLPAAHTCDNSIEIPNYIEAVLFGPESPYFCKKVVATKDKEEIWSLLNVDQRQEIRSKVADILQSKLNVASTNTVTYELDEAQYEERGSWMAANRSPVERCQGVNPLSLEAIVQRDSDSSLDEPQEQCQPTTFAFVAGVVGESSAKPFDRVQTPPRAGALHRGTSPTLVMERSPASATPPLDMSTPSALTMPRKPPTSRSGPSPGRPPRPSSIPAGSPRAGSDPAGSSSPGKRTGSLEEVDEEEEEEEDPKIVDSMFAEYQY